MPASGTRRGTKPRPGLAGTARLGHIEESAVLVPNGRGTGRQLLPALRRKSVYLKDLVAGHHGAEQRHRPPSIQTDVRADDGRPSQARLEDLDRPGCARASPRQDSSILEFVE